MFSVKVRLTGREFSINIQYTYFIEKSVIAINRELSARAQLINMKTKDCTQTRLIL